MSLWECKAVEQWTNHKEEYWNAISHLNKERLLELDRWYLEKLPDIIHSRHPPFMTKEEVVKLVDWKLTRGKRRPRLLQYARDAANDEVQQATKAGFALLAGDSFSDPCPSSAVRQALAAVSVLKGIGPATASAILSAFCSSIPFMSDEALLAVLGKRDYTVAQYMRLLEAMRSKARELSETGNSMWSAREIEMCLFAENAFKMERKNNDLKKRKR